MKNFFLLILAFTCLKSTSKAQAGILDKSFGKNGKVDASYISIYGIPRTALIQNDGKILLVGQTFYTYDILMARYLKTGKIDSLFADNGIYNGHTAGGFAQGNPIAALQKDGRIVVAGNVFTAPNTEYPTVSRYLPNGFIDSSFGKNGITSRVFDSKQLQAQAIAIQPDNKIIIAGGSTSQGKPIGVMRFNSDGGIDTSFGKKHNGFFQTILSKNGNVFWTVAIQPDGKIIVGGSTSGYINDYVILRITVDGRLDSSFGNNGMTTTDFCKGDDDGKSLVIQPDDGKIILAGLVHCGTYYNFGLARYLSNGKPDSLFGTGGKVITDFSGFDDYATSVAVEPNGKIIAGGVSFSSSNPNSGNFALAQYKTNGELDSSFGNNGKTTTDFHSMQDWAYDAALQKDGKIILCGFVHSNFPTGFALARYNGDECLINNSCNDRQLKTTSESILKLMPNPVKNMLTISFESSLQTSWHITVSNIYGKLYNNLDWNARLFLNTKHIDVSLLPKGIYIINIYRAGEHYSSKFIKN